MWKYIKKLFFFNESKPVIIRIPTMYSITILNDNDNISYIDKKFIELLLNFTPQYNNLKCEINRWDNYIEYMENVRAFIYCEATTDKWNHLGNHLLELREFITNERKRDIDDFNSFLHLIDVDDEENERITDVEIIKKTISFINNYKRDFQKNCNNVSKVYISIGSSVNGYDIVWGEKNYFNLISESYG